MQTRFPLIFRPARVVSGLLLWLAAGMSLPAATPSHEDPFLPLMIWRGPALEQPAVAAYGLDGQIRKELADLNDLLAKDRLKAANMSALGALSVKGDQLRRLGNVLELMGEPAGVDFQLRASAYQDQISLLIGKYRDLPGVAAQVSKAIAQLQLLSKQRAQNIPKIEKLIQQEKWEEAEAALYGTLDELLAMVVWHGRDQRAAALKPFNAVQSTVTLNVKKWRLAQTEKALAELRAEVVPAMSDLVRQVLDAAGALHGAATVNWRDAARTGPEIARDAIDQWIALHLAAVHTRAVDWARGQRQNVRPPSELDALLADHKQFTQDMQRALVAVIEADSARATQADAQEIYLAYLDALAPLAAALPDTLALAVRSPLDSLAARAPEFAIQVDAYRAATTDLLRWRQRTAADYAGVHQARYAAIAEPALLAVRSTRDFKGLVTETEKTTVHARLLGPAPPIVETAAKRLVGQKATVANLVGLTGGSRAAISRYADRIYARVDLPDQVDAEIAALRADLMVSDQTPPLTLEAAMAVTAATRGDLSSAGGEITTLHLEPLVSRMVNLPPAAWMLIPPGDLPSELNINKPLEEALLRFTIRPKWLQYRYFFVELAP